jgi:hypothetical protein
MALRATHEEALRILISIGNEIDAAFIFAGSDFGPVAHRIIVKEVSQTPPPPPISSVTHVRADENER